MPKRPGALGVYVETFRQSTEYQDYYAVRLGGGTSPCALPTYGALIDQVQRNGPAARAGLHGGQPFGGSYAKGDVIVSLDGHPIIDTDVLTAELVAYSAGQTVDVGVVRCNGERLTIPVTLGVQESTPGFEQPTISTTANAPRKSDTGTGTYPDCYIAGGNIKRAYRKLPKTCRSGS